MSKISAIVDTEWLTKQTGDQFADNGGSVISFLYQLPQFKGKEIIHLIEFMAQVYVYNWKAKLHPFFLNSTITQPAYKDERKIEETIAYYTSLLNETAPHQEGNCRISGRKTKLFSAGRHNNILCGSGTFINFNANWQSGILLSKEMLIRIFFVPFGTHRLADKIALISSNNTRISEFFAFRNCIGNMKGIEDGTAEGILKSRFNNPANALFRFMEDYMKHLQKSVDEEEKKLFNVNNTGLYLYHFSNFGANPEISMHSFDNNIFKFYALASTMWPVEWKCFINAHYKPDKDAFFNAETGSWERKGEEITFEDYSRWRNFALNNLLNNYALHKYFLSWSKDNYLPFDIVKLYQTELRNMKKEQIDKIKVIADFIVNYQPDDLIEKTIVQLNSAATRKEFEQCLVRLQKQSYEQEAPVSLMSIDDYAEYLVPENGNWVEIRNLIVIGIYENRQVKNFGIVNS